MAKSVFITRHAEIVRSRHINDLVCHLYDPERWPMDLDAYLAKRSGNGLVLATAVIDSCINGDPEFRRYAEALAGTR